MSTHVASRTQAHLVQHFTLLTLDNLHIKGSSQHTSMSVLYCVAGDVDPLPSTDDSTVLGLIVCIVDRYGEKLGDQKTLVKTSELILGELSCVRDGGREFTG